VGPDAPTPDETPTVALTSRPASGRNGKRVAVLAATGILIFLIAMVVVTGIERVKGSPLSGGEGTSIGEVFGTAPSATTTSSSEGEDDETTSARATDPDEPSATRATTTTRTTATTTRSRGGVPGTTLETPTP
jgi:cytoskeletal protein RodZ